MVLTITYTALAFHWFSPCLGVHHCVECSSLCLRLLCESQSFDFPARSRADQEMLDHLARALQVINPHPRTPPLALPTCHCSVLALQRPRTAGFLQPSEKTLHAVALSVSIYWCAHSQTECIIQLLCCTHSMSSSHPTDAV